MEYIDTDSPLRLGRVTDTRTLSDLLPALEPGEGFQLECDGQVVGALISPRDLELYLELLREYEDKVDHATTVVALKEDKWVDWDQVKADLGV